MSDKNVNERKRKKITQIMGIVSLLVIMGVSYAFFSASVSNANKETITVGSATISLEFDDNDNGISGTLNLGESITKKFTLENTGTVEAYAKINWYNLVNTYMNGSLTYTLEQSDADDGTYTSIGNGNVPVSNAETTETIKNGILVPVNTKYYYKLTITFNNLENVNQNSDINANFHSFFSLEEGNLSGADKIQNLVAGADTSSTNVITKTAPAGASCTNTLAYDGTTDNNLRYVGTNPCNYVTFNGETAGWRIVGIMNNVDDGTGTLETRIKLVRRDSLGEYSWDTSSSSVNLGYGINDWTQADLKKELNGDYLNKRTGSTYWYNSRNNLKTELYDYTKGLTVASQNLIKNAKWSLGGAGSTQFLTEGQGKASNFYEYERGTNVWGNPIGVCNDGVCPRSLFWIGKVALMYPSDYGFAVGGEVRNICLEKNMRYYSSDNCYTNNWMFISSWQWLLSPSSHYSDRALGVDYDGDFGDASISGTGDVRPTIYLKSNISFSGGNGSETDPYVIE